MAYFDRRRFLRTSSVVAAAAGASSLRASPVQAASRVVSAGESPSSVSVVGAGACQQVDVLDVTAAPFNAKRDTVRAMSGGRITAGSTMFVQSGSTFVDTDRTKVVTVQGAGLDGAVLTARIDTVVNTTTVILSRPALTTVLNAGFSYGTDDTPAMVMAIRQSGGKKTIFAPAGIYTILGETNDHGSGKQLRFTTRGGLVGEGGRYLPDDPTSTIGTMFLCGDAAAGVLPVAAGRYEGFMVDGNNLATIPLSNASPTGTTVGAYGVGSPTGGLPGGSPVGTMSGGGPTVNYAHFVDVWSTRSAGNGFSIFAVQNNSYYDCGTTDNAKDGLYLDGGAGGLDFFNFYERGSLRYGLKGDWLIQNSLGYKTRTGDNTFFGGTFDGHPTRRADSRAHLIQTYHWEFFGTKFVGDNLTRATIEMVQFERQSYGMRFVDCEISATPTAQRGGRACILISGKAPQTYRTKFAQIDRCSFTSGDHSVTITDNNRYWTYTGADWVQDDTMFGPYAVGSLDDVQLAISNATLPDADALLHNRAGAWKHAVLTGGWTGAVQYRITRDGAVELQGEAQTATPNAARVFDLPLGYRPIETSAFTLSVPLSDAFGAPAGKGQLTIANGGAAANPGAVAAAPYSGKFALGTRVKLDGIRFSVRTDSGAHW